MKVTVKNIIKAIFGLSSFILIVIQIIKYSKYGFPSQAHAANKAFAYQAGYFAGSNFYLSLGILLLLILFTVLLCIKLFELLIKIRKRL